MIISNLRISLYILNLLVCREMSLIIALVLSNGTYRDEGTNTVIISSSHLRQAFHSNSTYSQSSVNKLNLLEVCN
jgi:hypothetical protein